MKRLVARRLLWLLPLALAMAACQGPPGGTPGGTPVVVTTGLEVWLRGIAPAPGWKPSPSWSAAVARR